MRARAAARTARTFATVPLVPTWLIIVLAVFALLMLGGMVSARARRRRTGASFAAHLSEIDRALAEAFAQDRGWHRSALEAAARSAWEERRPGEPVASLELVEVIDLPGTASDRAVFRMVGEGGAALLTLGRRDDAWVGEQLVAE